MIEDSSLGTFSRWRAILWPIHRYELKKVLPMLGIFLLMAFNYNVLRCMKDTLVVTAEKSGAEVIPFIKVWVMFPMSVLITFLFIRLSNRFSREHVFCLLISFFLIFFFFFAFFFYPKSDQFHLHSFADFLSSVLPEGFRGFISMFRYWSFTIFYTMAELWSNIILTMLCWGYANQITRIDEAKRFYGIFGVAVNVSGIFAGQLSILASTKTSSFFPIDFHGNPWGPTLANLVGMVLVAGVLALLLFAYLNKVLAACPELTPAEDSVAISKSKKKVRFSLSENIQYLLSSKYMLCLVAVIISYNVVINLTEILWKHEMKELYPTAILYNLFMSKVMIWTSIVATLASLLVSGNSLRMFGWTKTALITPMILLLTSFGFFLFFFMKGDPHITMALSGFSPLQIVVFFGTLQNCFSRAAKYTVFDATKEMAFIPLTQEEKVKGKAAVDGICNRLGKSGGSLIYQVLLVFCTSITTCAPYVALILFGIIGLWMMAVRNLGEQFQEKILQTSGVALPKEAEPVLATVPIR